jgi:hypothetical protein
MAMPFSHLRRWTPRGFEAAHNVAEPVERFTSADTAYFDAVGLRDGEPPVSDAGSETTRGSSSRALPIQSAPARS